MNDKKTYINFILNELKEDNNIILESKEVNILRYR